MAGSFAVPKIGTLPNTTPSEAGQFLSAVGTAPQDAQTYDMQMAQTKLATNEANASNKLLPDQLADQQAELGQKGLARLIQAGMTNPAVTKDPQFGKLLEHFGTLSGVPVAKNADGSYNLAAMIPKREMTEEEQTHLAGLDPAARQAELAQHPELTYSPAFANMPAQLSAAEKSQAYITYRTLLDKAADPKGSGIDGLRSFAETPAGKALFPNLSSLANDPEFQNAISNRVDAFVNDQRYKDVIRPGEMADIARKRLDLENKRLTMTETDRAKDRADREARYAQQANQWTRAFGQKERDFDLSQKRFELAQKSQSAGAIAKYASELQASVTSMQAGYDSLQNNIRGYVTAGQDAPQALLDQRDALGAKLDNARALADVARTQAGEQLSSTVRTVSGAPNAQVVGGNLGAPVATDRTGRQVYQSNGSYVYADGTPYRP